MKTCFKCLTEKPPGEFYAHPRMADGRLGKCKTCTKVDTLKDKERKSLDPEWVEKELDRYREKSRRPVKPVWLLPEILKL